MGATVTTTASEAGSDLVKSLGADQIINYKTEKFEEILKDYDAVFDTIGGTTLEKSFNIIKSGGNIVSVSGMPNARFGKEFGSGFFKTLLFSLASKNLLHLKRSIMLNIHFIYEAKRGSITYYRKLY